jgi:hypothetical protein
LRMSTSRPSRCTGGLANRGKGSASGHLEVATTLENYASAYRAKDIRAKHA